MKGTKLLSQCWKEIRVSAMKRIVDRIVEGNKWKADYGPLIKDRFDKIKEKAVKWHVTWNGEKGCEVSRGRFTYTVNLKQKPCSCRLCHNTYLKAYENALQPINRAHEWKKSGLDAIQPTLVPKKSVERSKKNRRKSKIEANVAKGKLQKTGMIIYNCRICGQVGHNKRRCAQKGSASSKVFPSLHKSAILFYCYNMWRLIEHFHAQVNLKKYVKNKGTQPPKHIQQKKDKEKQKIEASLVTHSRKVKSNFKSDFIYGVSDFLN
ncbi:hypothetical protein PTKIN_Ptkin04bG0099400 [Pterospermum kingtungense]